MQKSFRAPYLSIFLALFGCSTGTDGHTEARAGGDSSVGGMSALAGSTSTSGGALGSAGMTGSGGQLGIGGATSSGGSGARAGGASSGGGAVGHAGMSGASAVGGGLVAGASSNTGGSSAGGGGGGPAPTFSMIYDNIITPTCGGTQCHLKKPTPYGYDFSSKTAASESWRADVFPGDGAGSPMFQVLNFGIMPKDKPVLSVEQLYMVLDWIDAGALDN